MKIPCDMPLEAARVVVDSREQAPWNLDPLPITRGSLQTGDYGLHHLPGLAAIERKSLPDFIACCGVERERFTRELERLRAFPVRAVILECDYRALERGEWRSKITPESVMSSVARWVADGIPIIFATDHERAGNFARRMLYLAARERYRQCRSMLTSATEEVAVA